MTGRLATLAPLVGAMLVVILTPLAHALLRVPLSELELMVLSYVPGVFILLWMADDAYRRRCTPCYDFGFLMWYLFPVTLLGYLLWTRGWRGIAVFIGFLSLMYGPLLATDFIRVLLVR